MNKWIIVAALGMALVWSPFLYKELTSEQAEKRARDLPTAGDDDDEEEVVVFVADEEDEEEDEAEEEVAEPEAEEVPQEPPLDEQAATAEAELPQAMAAAAQLEGEPGEGDEGEEAAEPPPAPPMLQGPAAVFRQAFESEPRDALWASETEQQLATMLTGGELPEDLFQAATCRKAVCQIELQWSTDNAKAYMGVSQQLSERFGHHIGVDPTGEPGEDGKQQLHVYVLRKGYNLEDLAQ